MTASDTLLIRLPNWLGDVVMTLPVIRALNPKFQLTFRGLPAFAPILRACFPQVPYDPLPPRERGYYRHFWRYRGDFHHGLLFTNSERGDWETILSGVKERYGLTWTGRKRLLLNHRYEIATPENGATLHQTQEWINMAAFFQLIDAVNFDPFPIPHEEKKPTNIVVICGSANNPAKRWNVLAYRELIIKLLLHYPHSSVTLTGTKQDSAITSAVARGMPVSQVDDLAGKTSLNAFLKLLQKSHFVIGNDTGGLHLANAFGIPTIGIFGPTNPLRTAPIFKGNTAVVLPPNSPATGGGDIDKISVEQVFQTVRTLIK